VNHVINSVPDADLSFDEIFQAGADRRLLALLAHRYGHLADFTFATHSNAANLEEMEAALRDAASAFQGRAGKPIGPLSGVCLVMDIILESIQQQFFRSSAAGFPSGLAPRHPFLLFMQIHPIEPATANSEPSTFPFAGGCYNPPSNNGE
jgi:hypothetical protein